MGFLFTVVQKYAIGKRAAKNGPTAKLHYAKTLGTCPTISNFLTTVDGS